MAECSDDFRTLMCRIGEGSQDAAWELVNRYGDEIRRAVRRVLNAKLRSKFDSLDFVQLVWKSFFEVRDRIDQFSRPEELAAYLVTMARNKVGMEVRRRLMTEKYNVRHEQPLTRLNAADGCLDATGQQPTPADVAIAHEQWERMLKDQPDHCREIIHLRLQGHTYQSIADAVHVDKRTVCRFFKKLLDTTSA